MLNFYYIFQSLSILKMFLPQDYTSFQIKKKKVLKVRLSESPDFNVWKLSTLNNYRKKQHYFLRDFSFGDIGKEANKNSIQKVSEESSNNTTKSSFQIYKNKQKQSKQKLQLSQNKSNQLKSDQFYCTLKVRQSRSRRRRRQSKPQILESQIGKINTQRIQIRSRSQATKTSYKKQRQNHKSQCSPRKSLTSRQFSIDLNDNSPQLPQKSFVIRKINQKNTNFELSRPCRPWSPFHNLEQISYPCEQSTIFI